MNKLAPGEYLARLHRIEKSLARDPDLSVDEVRQLAKITCEAIDSNDASLIDLYDYTVEHQVANPVPFRISMPNVSRCGYGQTIQEAVTDIMTPRS